MDVDEVRAGSRNLGRNPNQGGWTGEEEANLETTFCVVGRVDRSGPTAHVEMASPPSSSQCSDVTDFSTSEESDSGVRPSLGSFPMSDSSSARGSPMDLDVGVTLAV